MSREVYVDSFLIEGTEVIDYVISYMITRPKLNEGDAYGTVYFSKDIKDVLLLSDSVNVVVSRGVSSSTEQYLLRGHFVRITEQADKITCTLQGRFADYKKKRFTYSYDVNNDPENGNYSLTFKDIIEDGGLSCSVVDSGTGEGSITYKKFVSNDQTRHNRALRIAKILNWQVNDDYDADTVRLEPSGYTSYSTKLVVGDNVVEIPDWVEDRENVVNKITIKGVRTLDTRTAVFSGDGSESTFSLDDRPESLKVSVGGVLQVQGAEDQDASYNYYVDQDLKKIVFHSSSIPASGSDNISVEYTTFIERPVVGSNPTSISKYGEKENSYEFKDATTIVDARTRLNQLLKYLPFPYTSTTLKTINTVGIMPGLLVDIDDPFNPDYSNSYVIKEVTYQYPDPVDLVKVGSTDFSITSLLESIDARIKELENANSGVVSILTQVISLNKDFGYERRDFRLKGYDITVEDPDTLYWNSKSQGVWGSFNWGDGSGVSYTDYAIQQGNNIYKELLYDDKYVDAANTTCTQDTGNRELTFTAGEAFQTSKISLGQLFSYFTLVLPSYTGTFTIQISGDGGATWQTVTLNQKTEFDSIDGTGVLLRITESGSSTGSIENNYNTNEVIIQPAIGLIME